MAQTTWQAGRLVMGGAGGKKHKPVSNTSKLILTSLFLHLKQNFESLAKTLSHYIHQLKKKKKLFFRVCGLYLIRLNYLYLFIQSPLKKVELEVTWCSLGMQNILVRVWCELWLAVLCLLWHPWCSSQPTPRAATSCTRPRRSVTFTSSGFPLTPLGFSQEGGNYAGRLIV